MSARQRCQPEVIAQRGSGVVGAKDTAVLQQGHHAVDERIKAAGGDVRDQDEPVGGIGLHEIVDRRRDGLRRSDERLPAGDLDDQFARRQFLRLGSGTPFARDRDRVAEAAHAGTTARDGVLAHDRVHGRQRSVRVVAGKIAIPELFEELDRGLRRYLSEAHLAGKLSGLGIGVTDDERGCGQDE